MVRMVTLFTGIQWLGRTRRHTRLTMLVLTWIFMTSLDKFDDPNLPGTMQVTISLKKVQVGTEVNIVQEGIPDMIPVEACYLGWQESLALLTLLVEAEIQ